MRDKQGDTVDQYTLALGAEVRAELGARGWRKGDAQEHFGIDYQNFYRYFLNLKKPRSPDVTTVRKVAHGFGMTLGELLDRVEARLLRIEAGSTEADE